MKRHLYDFDPPPLRRWGLFHVVVFVIALVSITLSGLTLWLFGTLVFQPEVVGSWLARLLGEVQQ